jgi:phosphatidylethanolamine-binding protein (PEBP) family uncharacterized protein
MSDAGPDHLVRWVGAAAAALVTAAVVVGGCARDDGRQLQPPAPGATAATTTVGPKVEAGTAGVAFTLTSPAFANGAQLPEPHTCAGAGDPPPLAWNEPLETAAEFALVAKDLDESGTIQWVVGAIPADVRALTPDALPAAVIDFGYQAPCPQPGDPAHVYAFTLYALAQSPGLAATMTPSQAAATVESQPAQAAQLTAFYGR